MLSHLAAYFMIFVDRIFLASYSAASFHSAVSAGTWAWAFMGGFGMLSSMSEVFVAQFNGAKRPKLIGPSIWQMIWISLLSVLFFWPIALYGSNWIFPMATQVEQRQYFSYLLVFAPFYVLMTALSGFYIGRGKTALLIYLAILGNVLNIIFDALFIFGLDPWIPEMGIKGAAIATSLGYIVQAVLLFAFFMHPSYRNAFATNNHSLNIPLFIRSCKVGLPQGVFYMLEIAGIAIFYECMHRLSKDHIAISGICQTFLILLSFFIEGVSRGVTAISGNFIGSKYTQEIQQVLKSGVYLQCGFSLLIALAFFAPTESVLYLFPTTSLEPSAIGTLWFCLVCAFFYISFEGIRWIVAGILTAAGDTLFLLIAGSLNVWLLLIIPIYILIEKNALSVEMAWSIYAAYSLLSCLIYLRRYQKGSWKKIQLIQEEENEIKASTNPLS